MQTKLEVGAHDDVYEQEADRVADDVMQMTDAPSARPVRHQIEDEWVQAKPVAGASAGAASLGHAAGLHGPGAPLPASERAFFEPRFGQDFGAVRVHAGSDAFRASDDLNARAFTTGTDIAFGPGQYAPGTTEGRRLLAHELAHVVQQNGQPDGIVRRAVIPQDEDCEHAEYPASEIWYDDIRLDQIRDGERQAYLRVGSSGQAVVLVQDAVTAWGCDEGFGDLLPRFGTDGVFGRETHGAVVTFQGEQVIDTDGIVGPITLGELDTFVEAGGGESPPPQRPSIECEPATGKMVIVTVVENECVRACRRQAQVVVANALASCCELAHEAFKKTRSRKKREAIRRRFKRWQRENFHFLMCMAATANLACLIGEMAEKNCPEGDPCCPALAEDRDQMPPIIQEHCPKAGTALTLCPFSPLVS